MRCRCTNLKGNRCANHIWSLCLTGDKCFKHSKVDAEEQIKTIFDEVNMSMLAPEAMATRLLPFQSCSLAYFNMPAMARATRARK